MVDTGVIKISIYADKNKRDADYLKASLEAIHAFTKRKIEINVVPATSSFPQKTVWLFWLSDKPLPAGIAAQNIFKYEGEEIVAEHSLISVNAVAQPIKIYKRTVPGTSFSQSTTVDWQDAFGNPLLVREKNVDGNIYHFYSRFNPQWNDLVWNDAFPSLLLQLIFKDDIERINHSYPDVRAIDVQQMQTAFIKSDQKTIPATVSDLSNIFWLIFFLLFCAERIISFKTKTNVAA